MLVSYIKMTASYLKSRLGLTSDDFTNFGIFMLALAIIVIPESSFAQAGSDAVAKTICSIVSELQGPVARGVAAFGIIFLGFSLFLGKISWGVALALGIGIGAIFGANEIVGIIGDGTNACEGIDTNQ